MHVELPSLSPTECADILARIENARSKWIVRQGSEGFYTLGPSAYDLDAIADENQSGWTQYYARSSEYNIFLDVAFGDFYTKIISVLEMHFGVPINLTRRLGYPNFHIWMGFAIPSGESVAHSHFDNHFHGEPYASEWGANPLDIPRCPQFSLTLPIRLPKAGGGLNIWDFTYEDYLEALSLGLLSHPHEGQRYRKKSRIVYQEGVAIVHSGLSLHQIMSIPVVEENDLRITFQAHGVNITGKGYELFW